MTEEVEEAEAAEEADGAEDSTFVTFSKKALVGAVQAALTLTTCPGAQIIWANGQKKRPNNNKPKPITLHGKDSSKLHHNPTTIGPLKSSGVALLQFSMETIGIGSRCSPAT